MSSAPGTIDPIDPEDRIEALRAQVAHHNERYHTLDSPEISDADFDALVRELRALEADHPELAEESSPSGQVGGAISTTFDPVTHRVPLMSLDNAMNGDELRAWAERVAKGLGGLTPRFVCELKFDGLAISLRFEQGRFVQAATRGDGRVGEDVTANVATIGDIPHELTAPSGSVVPDVLEVRGEIYMTRSAFERMNERALAAGEKAFVNPRNSAAGSLRQKNPAVTASRSLSFFSYQLGEVVGGPEFTSHVEMLQFVASLGLPLNDHMTTRRDGRRRGGPLPALAGAPPRPRLRDRRDRRQARRPRPARSARRHVEGPALGDRLQVPAGRADDDPARHPDLGRPHGPGDALRRARARVRRRIDRRDGDAAQPGPGGAEGRPSGRHGGRAQGR